MANFLPVFCKPGKYDWLVVERIGKLEEIIRFYESLRDKDANGKPIIDEEKTIFSSIKKSMKDRNKLYEAVSDYVPKDKPEIKSKDHMPDREESKVEDDMPF